MPTRGPSAESFRSRCGSGLRRFLLRFTSPDKYKALMVLRRTASILSGFPSTASRERLAGAEAGVRTLVQSALRGRSRLSRGNPLLHAEEVFMSARRIAEAAADVRRKNGLWPLVTETVRDAAVPVRSLETHLYSRRKHRDASRERLREALESSRRQLVRARLHAHAASDPGPGPHELLALFQRVEELIETLQNRPARG